MPIVQYAFREDKYNILSLTQGCTSANSLCQIAVLRKRETLPAFLEKYMSLDVKGSAAPASAISDFAKALPDSYKYKNCFAIIDSQIEFTVKPRVIHKISEFLPTYTSSFLYNSLEGQPYGFLLLLRVYCSEQNIPDKLMRKGRLGSAQIISLYDEFEEKTSIRLEDDFVPLIDDACFNSIKEELVHVLKMENALIGVYGNDAESKAILQQKRDLFNDNSGNYKKEFNEDDDIDHSLVDYEETYRKAIALDAGLRPFIKYVRQIKPPQMAECGYLLPKVANGDQTATIRLVEMYLRNIVRISIYFAEKYDLPLADVIQDGTLGFIKSITKFNTSNVETFQQYYPFWVRQSISREMATYYHSRYCPAHLSEKLFAIRDLAKSHSIDLVNDVWDLKAIKSEIATEIDVSEDRVEEYISYLQTDISYEKVYKRHLSTHNKVDISLVVDEAESIFEDVNQSMLKEKMNVALHTLTPREEQVIRYRYGLFDGRYRTLEEVGAKFLITRERVRQIEAKALRKLRHPSRSKLLKGFMI